MEDHTARGSGLAHIHYIKIWPLSARKEDMMKLVDTVNGMNSADYKERFIAEYQQLV